MTKIDDNVNGLQRQHTSMVPDAVVGHGPAARLLLVGRPGVCQRGRQHRPQQQHRPLPATHSAVLPSSPLAHSPYTRDPATPKPTQALSNNATRIV